MFTVEYLTLSWYGNITRFQDLEIWQLARIQTKDFDKLVEETTNAKDFELRNQMNASSGSVMDCIAEGFERSGNAEFNFFNYCQGVQWRVSFTTLSMLRPKTYFTSSV